MGRGWGGWVVVACASACSSGDDVMDGGADGAVDSTIDATKDAPAETSIDATIDAPKDATNDASDAGAKDADADAYVIDCPTQPTLDKETILSGTPSWRLGELMLFATDVGDFNDASAFNNTCAAIGGSKHAYDSAKLIMKSAVPHDPPFDIELEAGVPEAGFATSGCFALTDLDAPRGILIALNVVPSQTASTGVSFEQPDGGPVIEGYDFTFDGDLYIDGVLTDPNFDSTYPKVAFVYDYPKIPLDGFGHILFNFCENQAVSPSKLTAGNYRFELRMKDTYGNATLDVVRFGVK